MIINFNSLQKARNTVVDMLKDRGYDMSNHYDTSGNYIPIDINSINHEYYKNNMKIIANHSEKSKIMVLFYVSKIGIDVIKKIVKILDMMCIYHVILVVNYKVTSFAKREIIKLPSKYQIEIFLQEEVLYNIIKHRIVPKHILLTKKEAQKVIECYGNVNCLPRILYTDKICKYYNGSVGDIFKIYRENSIYYRVVVPGKK